MSRLKIKHRIMYLRVIDSIDIEFILVTFEQLSSVNLFLTLPVEVMYHVLPLKNHLFVKVLIYRVLSAHETAARILGFLSFALLT